MLDLDFTADPTQAFAANGDYVVGGLHWTKILSAAEAVHATNTLGTGLNFQPSGGGSDFNVAGMYTPGLWIPVSTLLGATPFDWSTRARLWVSLGADNAAAAVDGAVVGITSVITGAGVEGGLIMHRGYTAAAGAGTQILWGVHGVAVGGVVAAPEALSGANKTMMFECQGLGPSAIWVKQFRYAGLAPGAAFPAVSAMTPFYSGQPAGNNQVLLNAMTTLPADLGLLVGATGNTNYSTMFQRIRLDVRS